MINSGVGYTVYISGPMSGYDDLNEPAFREAAAMLRDIGYVTIVPHDIDAPEHDNPCPRSHSANVQGEHGAGCYLRGDIRALTYADAIYMLNDWETSVGARLELQVAAALGITVITTRSKALGV